MYAILIALSPSLLFLSSTSSSRLLALLFVHFLLFTGIFASTHVLSPNLSILNCVLSKIKPAVQIGSGMLGSETVRVFFGARACIQKLYEAGSASEKTHNTGGVRSRVVYKNLETSSSIHDNSGNLGEKRPPDRCRALRAD